MFLLPFAYSMCRRLVGEALRGGCNVIGGTEVRRGEIDGEAGFRGAENVM